MSEEPRPAVTNPVPIQFPWERVVTLLMMALTLSIAVMAADMLGYLPTPA